MQELSLNEDNASTYYLGSIILFSISRFIFTGLMKYFSPRNLLFLSAVGGGICTLIVIYSGGYTGVIALVIISGFMSLMFPTIYGLGMRKLGEDTKIGGSGLIMAILGGAVLTAFQGQLSDLTQSIHLSFFVPFACFIVVAIYAIIQKKIEPVSQDATPVATI
jgi:FHS family L-fucose permease-like MFS transporter